MNKDEYQKFLPNDNSWLIARDNGMLLSDYHIEVLARNGIDYLKYSSIKQILFDINDILDEEENEELETIARELDERNYYSSKKN